MRCPNCNSEMPYQFGSHNFLECGLDNVYLEGIKIYSCACGEEIISIPHMPDLHDLIGLELIKKKNLLNGKEVKFLRKNIGLTAINLAKRLGVNNATISRWENDRNEITTPHDRALRFLYAITKGIPTEKIQDLIEGEFMDIEPKHKQTPVRIPLHQIDFDCAA